MEIANEHPEDRPDIRALHLAAFPDMSEADLIERLRADGDVAVSLVARDRRVVVGHVLFSRMTAPVRALALAPVAVSEPHRRQGIAARLIRQGLDAARAQDWEAVFVLGDPSYYRRFGFDTALAAGFESRYAGPYLMALALSPGGLAVTTGRISHAPAFDALGGS